MSLTLQNLNNIRTLRAMAREFSIEALEEMLEKVRIVTEEKRNEQAEFEQQRAEQQDKINALLERMKADGISPADLLGSEASNVGQQAKKRKAREAKYRYIDVNGEEKTGPVRAARQNLLRAHSANGKSLDDFPIYPVCRAEGSARLRFLADAEITVFSIKGDIRRLQRKFLALLIAGLYRHDALAIHFGNFSFGPPIRGCTKSPTENIVPPHHCCVLHLSPRLAQGTVYSTDYCL